MNFFAEIRGIVVVESGDHKHSQPLCGKWEVLSYGHISPPTKDRKKELLENTTKSGTKKKFSKELVLLWLLLFVALW